MMLMRRYPRPLISTISEVGGGNLPFILHSGKSRLPQRRNFQLLKGKTPPPPTPKMTHIKVESREFIATRSLTHLVSLHAITSRSDLHSLVHISRTIYNIATGWLLGFCGRIWLYGVGVQLILKLRLRPSN